MSENSKSVRILDNSENSPSSGQFSIELDNVEALGAALFSIVNLGRKLDVDPEKSLGVSIKKFKKRISESIKLIEAEKVSDKHLTDKKLYEIWEHAKDLLKKNDN